MAPPSRHRWKPPSWWCTKSGRAVLAFWTLPALKSPRTTLLETQPRTSGHALLALQAAESRHRRCGGHPSTGLGMYRCRRSPRLRLLRGRPRLPGQHRRLIHSAVVLMSEAMSPPHPPPECVVVKLRAFCVPRARSGHLVTRDAGQTSVGWRLLTNRPANLPSRYSMLQTSEPANRA